MSHQLDPLDRNSIVAILILWALGFASAVAFGEPVIPAAALSLLLSGVSAIAYLVVDQDTRDLATRPSGAIGVFAGFSVLAGLSFAGDCVLGSAFAPDAPLLEACIGHSGAAFLCTLACVAAAVGVPAIGLLRGIVTKVWH